MYSILVIIFLISKGNEHHGKDEKHIREKYQIRSLLRNFNCGAQNLEVPYFLTQNSKATSKEPKVVVDIGLDNGGETIAAAQNNYLVMSFEPRISAITTVAAKLAEVKVEYTMVNLTEWKMKPPSLKTLVESNISVYLFNAAVGNKTGEIEIMIDEIGQGSSIVDKISDNSEKVTVPIVRLDDFIFYDIYFLKIDTQGYEYFVLEGARNLFLRDQIKTLMMEFYLRVSENCSVMTFYS